MCMPKSMAYRHQSSVLRLIVSFFYLFQPNKSETNKATANSEAIALINKYATIFADKSKMVPATFHDSFQKFIETFKEENYPQNYLSVQHKQ